jgi:hypothetical protein
MSVQRTVGVGLAATAIAGTLVALPAAANAARATTTNLTLSIRVEGQKTPKTVVLRCAPPRGTHPKASQACTAINGVKGQLTKLKPQDGVMCTMQYQPATAAAKGTWRGRSVQYKKTFSNSCALTTGTGAVFQF